jgi:hypothetical protein
VVTPKTLLGCARPNKSEMIKRRTSARVGTLTTATNARGSRHARYGACILCVCADCLLICRASALSNAWSNRRSAGPLAASQDSTWTSISVGGSCTPTCEHSSSEIDCLLQAPQGPAGLEFANMMYHGSSHRFGIVNTQHSSCAHMCFRRISHERMRWTLSSRNA